MTKPITLIIAEHNEGEQLKGSLESLYDTSPKNLFNTIVVSDGSWVQPHLIKGVRHIKHKVRKGVGAAFDTGANLVNTPYMVVLGSDIRFKDNNYLEDMIVELEREENEKAIICTANLAINAEKMDLNGRLNKRYGARILMFMKAQDLPPKGSRYAQLKDDKAVANYRNTIEAQWLSKLEEGTYDIPCVLGAFYGVRTSWYEYIQGFRGHRYWGTLEPLISLKSWLAGGSCRIASDIETAHIFKSRSSHHTSPTDLLYNKIVVPSIVFPPGVANKFIKFLGTNSHMVAAKQLLAAEKQKIDQLSRYFSEIRERDLTWFKEKFPFKDYDVLK